MTHSVVLKGCTTEPMGAYLKALAVFRLVTEQADGAACGYWQGNSFCLRSVFDEASLLRFFLETYAPTPLVAPWNGGSGFGEGEGRDGMDAILSSDLPRFADYVTTIETILAWPEIGTGEMTLATMLGEVQCSADALRPGKKRDDLLKLVDDFEISVTGLDRPSLLHLTTDQIGVISKTTVKTVRKLRTEAKKNRRAGGKDEIVRACRNRLGNRVVDWMDSVVVLRTATELNYPPILGTGGIEGRLDYTNSFMKRVSSLLLGEAGIAKGLLRNALFGERSDQFQKASVGQLDPGRAGGYNQGPEVETKDFPTNAWDFVLALEGAVAWASGAGRRQAVQSRGVMSSPFTVRSRSVGYGADEDESRAEVWMPLWTRPCSFEELRALLREGRAEWGARPVHDAVEFAEAAASLGVDRGIDSFQRFSLVERRGKGYYVALPLGNIPVRERRDADLLQEVDSLLQQMDSFARQFKSEVPGRFRSRRRQIDSAIYDFALHGGSLRLQNVLLALGGMEQYFADRDPAMEPKLGKPLFGLSVRWIEAADDHSLTFRIAAALASIKNSGKVGGIRANLASVEPTNPWTWVTGKGQKIWEGNSLSARMVNVLKRRMMDSERLNSGSVLPLEAAYCVEAGDVAQFLTGAGIDESRLETLLFACTLIDWPDDFPAKGVACETVTPIPRNYALLKHLFHPHPGGNIRPEPAILSLLSAGRTREACGIAQRRLRVSSLWPVMAEFPDEKDGTRLAASLLIPIHSLKKISRLVLHKPEEAAART